ncbi:MAG TPA: hypothetical protein PKZ92_01360 [Candidatus Woesebacteria bacterium]|jgi:hypothetical protein|nr:hypothetical protein [Candidatus Shapirobacteria bacterium]HOR01890.1 hypothetical protein [Candidatus Woesebacteria bacterium]
MKKLTAFSLIIVSSLLLSACVGPKNSPPADTDSSPVSQSTKDFSLRDLIAQNTPQKCLFSSQNRPENFEGEVIIHGPKFKQVINTKAETKDVQVNSLSDGQYFYTWEVGTDTKDGIKFKMDFNQPNNQDSNFNKLKITDGNLDTVYQGQCSPATVSDADFVPPQDIVFQDYTQFLEKIQSNLKNPDYQTP